MAGRSTRAADQEESTALMRQDPRPSSGGRPGRACSADTVEVSRASESTADSTRRRRYPDSVLDLTCARLTTLASRTRIRLLESLEAYGEIGATVDELHTSDLGISQNVSHHLQLLLRARLVRRVKQGQHMRYWLDDYTWRRPLDTAARSVEATVEEMRAAFGSEDDLMS